jgi:hypothetical protein
MSVSPIVTYVAAGNIRTAAALAASASATFTATAVDGKLDLSGWFRGTIYVKGTGGAAVAATSGLHVQIYRVETTGLILMMTAVIDQTLPVVASTVFSASWDLENGRYSITITNTDATNALSNVEVGLSQYIASIG